MKKNTKRILAIIVWLLLAPTITFLLGFLFPVPIWLAIMIGIPFGLTAFAIGEEISEIL